MSAEIKIRLLQLNKKQIDLLFELRKRGYPKMSEPTLSKYISGASVTPQAEEVRGIIDTILDEWESAV